MTNKTNDSNKERYVTGETAPVTENAYSELYVKPYKIYVARVFDKDTQKPLAGVEYYLTPKCYESLMLYSVQEKCEYVTEDDIMKTDPNGYTRVFAFDSDVKPNPVVSISFRAPKKEIDVVQLMQTEDQDLNSKTKETPLTEIKINAIKMPLDLNALYFKKQEEMKIEIDNRSATRQSIIMELRNQGVEFRTRSEWGANPKQKIALDWDYTKIAIHNAGNSYSCSHTNDSKIKKVEDEHKKKFDQFGYHYAVGCDGEILEGLNIKYKGAHIDVGNTSIIGIVLLADLQTGPAYDTDGDDEITTAQEQEVYNLVSTLLKYFDITELGGHREHQVFYVKNGKRTCPGDRGMELVYKLRRKFSLGVPTKFIKKS